MSSVYEMIKETKKAMFDNQELLKNYIDTLIIRINNEEDKATGSNYDECKVQKMSLYLLKILWKI